MKILSKYKDYYDWCVSLYEVDPKVCLDRRDAGKMYEHFYSSSYEPTLVKLAISGYIYEGVCKDGVFYWGEKMKEVTEFKRTFFYPQGAWFLRTWGRMEAVKLLPYLTNKNEAHNCPILFIRHREVIKYPKLEDLGFASYISAQEMFTLLYNYLSNKNTPKVEDKRKDPEKIVGKGFDLKKSFRHRKD